MGSERIGFERKFRVTIGADVFAALEQHSVFPLPNLQIYHCDTNPLPGQLVLGPNLLELELAFCNNVSEFLGLFSYLRVKNSSPLLRKITISRVLHSPCKLPDDFGDIVAHLAQLEILSVVGFTLHDDALRVLASSQIIRVLKSNNTPKDFL